MYAAPPIPNLLVIRSPNIERAVTFYETLGIRFERHSHGKGPEHYASETCGFVFEIYPQHNKLATTTNTRLGFNVKSVDACLELLAKLDVDVVVPAKDSEWGRRAVVRDLDGHTVELVTPQHREKSSQIQREPGMQDNKEMHQSSEVQAF